MKYAVISINKNRERVFDEMGTAFNDVFNHGGYQGEHFTFETPAALFSSISPKCWDTLNYVQGRPAMSIRSLAKQLRRDVKNTHGDVKKLLDIGLLEKDHSGKIYSPFDEVRTEFVLKGAA